MKRLNALIGMSDWPAEEWPQQDKDLYTLGKVRSSEKFFKTFGIHDKEHTVEHHLCRFVGKYKGSDGITSSLCSPTNHRAQR